MSKILANQIANYGDNSPIEVKEGLNIPTGKPLQVGGASGTNGQILSSTGSTIQWIDNFSGSYNDLTNLPTIPAAQVQSDWNAVGTVAEILNKPVIPAQSSVVLAAAGNSTLTYNSSNGEFTYTPPDLSGYATTANIANSSNWDAAYGWGDHAAVGYVTEEVDTLDTVTGRGASTTTGITLSTSNLILDSAGDQRIQHNVSGTETSKIIFRNTGSVDYYASNGMSFYATSNASPINRRLTLLTSGGVRVEYQNSTKLETTSAGVTITGDLSVSGTTDLDIEDLNNVDITGGLSDQQVLKWDSASSSWKPANDLVGGAQGVALTDLSVSTDPVGTAALSYNNITGVFTYTPPDLSGYLTSFTETDPVFAASPAANVTLSKINQWDTAYGWGNHANGGYLVATAQDKTNWNTAFGWGNHANAGYVTAETDSLDDVVGRGSSTTSSVTVGGVTVSNDGTSNGSVSISDAGAYSEIVFRASNGTTQSRIQGVEANLYLQSGASGLAWVNTYSIFYPNGDVFLNNGQQGNTTIGGTLTAGGLTYPTTNGTNGQVLTSDGAGNVTWSTVSGGGNTSVTISDTAPGSATVGDLWWESDKGRLKIYYNDTDSTQWVDASPPLQQDKIATSSAPATATSTGTAGEIRYDADYVYICVATNTWKRSALTTW